VQLSDARFRRLIDQLPEVLNSLRRLVGSENHERIGSIYALKCPVCGKKMAGMRENAADYSGEGIDKQELIYFCDQHGAMNKLTNLKDKADQVANKA